MRISELVSDWELDEIRQELREGYAPDVVAFRHGIPVEVMPRGKCDKGVQHHAPRRAWNDVETAFVRDNYRQHDRNWKGWSFLGRTWPSIEKMAHKIGVTRSRKGVGGSDAS